MMAYRAFAPTSTDPRLEYLKRMTRKWLAVRPEERHEMIGRLASTTMLSHSEAELVLEASGGNYLIAENATQMAVCFGVGFLDPPNCAVTIGMVTEDALT